MNASVLLEYDNCFGDEITALENRLAYESIEGQVQHNRNVISSPEFQNQHLWTPQSPEHRRYEQMLLSKARYPTYQYTEECGQLLFESSEEMGEYFQRHINALVNKIKMLEIEIGQKILMQNFNSDSQVCDTLTGMTQTMQCWKTDLGNQAAASFSVHGLSVAPRLSSNHIVTISLLGHMNGPVPNEFNTTTILNDNDMDLGDPSHADINVDSMIIRQMVMINSVMCSTNFQCVHLPVFLNSPGILQSIDGLAPQAGFLQLECVEFENILNALHDGVVQVRFSDGKLAKLVLDIDMGIHGKIVIISMNFLRQEVVGSMNAIFERALKGMFTLYRLALQGSLIVSPAGDLALFQNSFRDDMAAIMARCPFIAKSYINVVALASDGLHLTSTTNQPGAGVLADRTLSAIGAGVDVAQSTEIAAALVASAAALLKQSFPQLTMQQVACCLLRSATPIIVLNCWGEPFPEYVALEEVTAEIFIPGLAMSLNGARIMVTKEVYKQSRRKFGMGRLNLSGAITLGQRFLLEIL